MKKMWKRFWTLSKRRSGGFTLVELIVVIAILAILAGVGVPVYSGYVTKANKQADMTLISDIEQALLLAHYSGDLTEGEAGFIMIGSPDAELGSLYYDDNADVALAMEKSFGPNWEQAMQLKYDNWGTKSMILSHSDAKTVVGSNFVQKYSPDELMAQVQAVTDAVNGLQVEIAGGTRLELYNMFGYGEGQNVIDDVIAEYGIEKSWGELTSAEQSNLLVLATASSISNSEKNSAPAASVISDYALYTAYAAENPEFNAAYKTFQTAIANVDPSSADSEYDQIKAAYDTLQDAASRTGFNTWKSSNGDNNKEAFISIMEGVGNAMEDNGDKILSDLGNADMFSSGVGSELYNDYLNSAYAAAGVAGNDGYDYGGSDFVMEGYITIWYTVLKDGIVIDNSLPLDA